MSSDSERAIPTFWWCFLPLFHTISEIKRFFRKPERTSCWYPRQGSMYTISSYGFCKGEDIFLFICDLFCLSLNVLKLLDLFILAGISRLVAELLWFLGKMTSNFEKHWLRGQFLVITLGTIVRNFWSRLAFLSFPCKLLDNSRRSTAQIYSGIK